MAAKKHPKREASSKKTSVSRKKVLAKETAKRSKGASAQQRDASVRSPSDAPSEKRDAVSERLPSRPDVRSERLRIALFGAGFIGAPLVDALADRHHDVRVFSRGEYDVLEDVAPDLSGFDVVVNLIGYPIDPPWTNKRRKLILDTRVRSTAALSQAAQDAGAFFVQSSGTGIHGTGFLREVGVAWEAANRCEKTAICRFGLVIGDGGVAKKLAPLFCMRLGGVFGSGRQRVAWIARDSLVDTLVRIIENKTGGTHELAHELDARTFYSEFARALERPCVFRYPEWLLRIVMPRSHTLLTADTPLGSYELEDDDSLVAAIERSGLRC